MIDFIVRGHLMPGMRAVAAMISVPINFRLVPSEMEHVINNSDSVALFVGHELFEKLNLDKLEAEMKVRAPGVQLVRLKPGESFEC